MIWFVDDCCLLLLLCLGVGCNGCCCRVVVVSVLRRHGESTASVAEAGLRAIVNLAVDDENKTKLGECDACAGVWVLWACVAMLCM